MLKITDEQIESIRDQLSTATPQAVGYKLMVRPIEARKGMEAAEAEQYSELAKKGFEVKSEQTKDKETHGSDVGVVVAIGPDAYTVGRMAEMEPWCDVGDVVIFERYTGKRCELPPGSGVYYHFMDDDDIKGKYKGIEL